MKTISIKVETVGKGIRATLNTYVIGTGDVYQAAIKDPFSESRKPVLLSGRCPA